MQCVVQGVVQGVVQCVVQCVAERGTRCPGVFDRRALFDESRRAGGGGDSYAQFEVRP